MRPLHILGFYIIREERLGRLLTELVNQRKEIRTLSEEIGELEIRLKRKK